MKEIITQAITTTVILAITIIGFYVVLRYGSDKVTEEQQLREQLEQVTRERDLLSDAIRCHIDATDGECDILIDVRHFLRINNEDLEDFDKWCYCY